MATSQRATWQPDWAVAPGEVLLETLQERRMSQSELSHRLGRPLKTINEIIKGKAAITPETAIQLERALGISARFWTGLETRYRDALAYREAERDLEENAEWVDDFPIADLVRHRLIERGSTKAGTLENLLAFFGVSSPAAFNRLDAVASYRSSAAFQASPKSVAAWLRWGELQAAEVDVPPFDVKRFRKEVEGVRPLTRREPFDQIFTAVKGMCAASGVIVLVVPELSGTRLSGAARWIGARPVIQLTLRHKSNDQFWFSLLHEAGHLVSASRRRDFIDPAKIEDPKIPSGDREEEAANQFARDALLPPAAYEAFVEIGIFSRESVRRYAKDQDVAPGIVVGRLQRDGHISPRQLNDLKMRVDVVAGR